MNDRYIKGIRITGYQGRPKKINMPDEIDGEPVVEIGAYAFKNSPDLEEVSLPQTLVSLRAYAFHNCARLRKLTLHDGVELYYDGVIKHCEKLRYIDFLADHGDFTVLRQMTQDNDTRLTVTIYQEDGLSQLVIPSYLYDFDADDMARAIHHRIEGAGYAYRECITKKGINYADYDNIFERAIADNQQLAADVSCARLRYPYKLSKKSTERYREFIRENSENVCRHLAKKGDAGGISALEQMGLLSAGAMRQALDAAADPAVTAVLMDGLAQMEPAQPAAGAPEAQKNSHMPVFSLEDF